MVVGTCKWFDPKKGFGFLTSPTGEDVFVHYSVIEGDGFRRLFDGDQVEFEFSRGPKGLLATKARRLAPKTQPSDSSDEPAPPSSFP